MAKYMFVYRGGHEGYDQTSPEEMQKMMQLWMNWIQQGREAGWIVDGGDGLTPEGAIVNADGSITDGPYAESKELVGGYSMVQAPNLAEAVEIAKLCPIGNTGGSVEVREIVGGMSPGE